MFGEEPVGNYNRILLSSVLARTHDPKDIFLNPLPWYATNGDIWTRFPLRKMAAFHHERDAEATLALDRPRIPWGVVETDAFGHVLDFIEAPPSPYLINAGVYAFSAAYDHGWVWLFLRRPAEPGEGERSR